MFPLSKDQIYFPPVSLASPIGLLAYGGDLSVKRLILAYKNGIFPWSSKSEEILWWAPDPRMVLFPSEVKISKSMRQLIKKKLYKITEDNAFEEVIEQCAISNNRVGEDAWLYDEMIAAYIRLHHLGLAHSVEVWNQAGKLVGGLYTVQVLPHIISGESMFHLESNTSKLAFIHLAQSSEEKGVQLIDCQIHTSHLESLGAKEIPRDIFMDILQKEL